MTQGKTSSGSVYSINVALLAAFSLGSIAWWVWPNSTEGWGFGVASVLLGFAAFGKSIEALKLIQKMATRKKTLSNLTRDAIEQKSSSLVSEDELRNAGMIE